ncbi:hypothetical protein [Paucisalibacillus globulus]|uniref:hypothetical protein n=1 Tax=Paucisalibacillus globulus TaxID=351095 RepID=UPI000568E39A|nr:hypothetical protein [Paucisalibacillus globulus]
MKRLGVFIFIVMTFFYFLVACASSDNTGSKELEQDKKGTESVESKQEDESEETKEEDIESTEEETESEKADTKEYAACKGILFSVGEEIDGRVLADCVIEAMLVQQTGTHIVKDESGITTTVDFKWDPHFSLATHNDEFSVVLKEDTGWMKTLDGRWIQEDPNSTHPETITANAVINGYRVFADPRFIGEFLAMVNTWTVAGEEPVPDADSFADKAWKLTTDDVIDMEISVVSDLEFWITSDYLGAYFVATGTMGNVSARTSNTFTQWGGEVDIPEPE